MEVKRFLAYVLLTSALTVISGNNEENQKDTREDTTVFQIGLGLFDITGPAAEVGMMGYAHPDQVTRGIHFRIFSRAFIIDDGLHRLVYVSADCGMAEYNVKLGVIERLNSTYGSLYRDDNVIISGTHTHSGPGGFLQYFIFDITTLGFVWESYNAMVEGIYQSIVEAHNSLQPGRVLVSQGMLDDASINRSPSAYFNNPREEKDQFEDNTDNVMILARFEDFDGNSIGMFNWFAVHPTSMNNTNPFISGDNKGTASQLFERLMEPDSLPGQSKFVAAFVQANCGDISPNTDGAKCQDTGLPCDILHSTCGGTAPMCYALGPGRNMFESAKIIGEKQYQKAVELFFDPDAVVLNGSVGYAHQFIDMSNYDVTLSNGTVVTTCSPALGYSFAAGTTDGPGALDFTQGTTEEVPFWDFVVNAIKPVDPVNEQCHEPKPILLDSGNYNTPYAWHPRIIPTQVAHIGQLIIPAVPGEFTTMAGRRLKTQMETVAEEEGIMNPISVVSGLSNEYSHYITTFEEYQIQRYEGASTIYGPRTLEAYMQQYSMLLSSMLNNVDVESDVSPPDLRSEVISLLPEILYDGTPEGYDFGDVIAHPYPLVYIGEEVIAKFVAGNPRNDVMLNGTFLTIERKILSGWEVFANDANWQTKLFWEKISSFLGTSEATVFWVVTDAVPEGTYRIRHFGHYKSFFTGKVMPYEGTTNSFKVKQSPAKEVSVSEEEERENNMESGEVEDEKNGAKAGDKALLSLVEAIFG